MKNRRSLFAKLLLLLTTVIWGSTFVVIKDALDSVPMFFLLSIRFLCGGVIVSLICIKKWKKITWGLVWRGAVTGIFLAAAYVAQTVGLKYTTPGTSAFLSATYAVLVPFIMWAVTRKAPTLFNIVAAILGLIGIGLVSFNGGFGAFNFMGEGMTIICSVFFALQIVSVSVLGKHCDNILFTAVELIFCGMCMLIIYLSTELNQEIVLNFDSIWKLGYLTLFGSVFALLAMTYGIANTEANESALIMSLEAVFGVIFSILVYKEKVTVQVGIGFAVIFIALVVSEYVNEKYLAWKLKKSKVSDINTNPKLY